MISNSVFQVLQIITSGQTKRRILSSQCGKRRTKLFKELGGRAPFTLTEIPDNTLASDEYMMATTRTHDQFNTTIYGLDDRYRGIKTNAVSYL
jgi:hypothetical protein